MDFENHNPKGIMELSEGFSEPEASRTLDLLSVMIQRKGLRP